MSNAAAATLHALIEREWQYQLEHSPTYASVLGDRRWNARWDDHGLSAIEADHQHNLLDGSLPLDMLERRIDAWVARTRAGAP